MVYIYIYIILLLIKIHRHWKINSKTAITYLVVKFTEVTRAYFWIGVSINGCMDKPTLRKRAYICTLRNRIPLVKFNINYNCCLILSPRNRHTAKTELQLLWILTISHCLGIFVENLWITFWLQAMKSSFNLPRFNSLLSPQSPWKRTRAKRFHKGSAHSPSFLVWVNKKALLTTHHCEKQRVNKASSVETTTNTGRCLTKRIWKKQLPLTTVTREAKATYIWQNQSRSSVSI